MITDNANKLREFDLGNSSFDSIIEMDERESFDLCVYGARNWWCCCCSTGGWSQT